jgi:hypothetical protein
VSKCGYGDLAKGIGHINVICDTEADRNEVFADAGGDVVVQCDSSRNYGEVILSTISSFTKVSSL